MKYYKLCLLIFIISFVFTGSSLALHLTCVPQSDKSIVKYEVILNGEIYNAPLQTLNNGNVRLWYNIDSLIKGNYKVQSRSINHVGTCSSWSKKFNFNIPYRKQGH